MPRIAAVAALTLLGLLAFSVPALGAGDPPPVPKPDPPPKVTPPPPPHFSGPPPAAQPVAPVVAHPAAPAVVHPTAAERRAAAARNAQRKAARAARARRSAAKKVAAAHSRERAAPLVATSGTSSSSWGTPFLIVAFSAALLLLGLALTPARAVPWSRASHALDENRDELGVLGAMGLVATLVFFLLVQVTN